MAKVLSRIKLKNGKPALIVTDERGWVCHYTEDGMMLANVERQWEILEGIGKFDTEAEFRMLVGKSSSVYVVACPLCGKPVLMRIERGGRCRDCGFFVPDEPDDSDVFQVVH